MKPNKILAYSLILGLSVAACKPTLDAPTASPGTANFAKYVSFGNSLTSGFADNGLYNEGIINSYPNFIAQQLAKVGGGSFVVPAFPDANSNGSGYQALTGFTTTTIPSPIIGAVLPNAQTGVTLLGGQKQLVRFTGANNNLGVPGLAVWQITTGSNPTYNLPLPLAQINPYFERLVAENSTKDYVQVAADSDHTFFTFWLGNNDVLSYATNGGQPSSSAFITPTATFEEKYDKMVNALTAKGAKGVLGTVPDVTALPFFTTANASIAANANPTAPKFPTFTLDATKAGQLNALYTGNGYTGHNFVVGENNFVVSIDAATKRVKHFDPTKDFFTLPGSAVAALFASGIGSATGTTPTPIPDNAVLDETEVLEIRTATTSFNNKIKAVGAAKGLAVVDAKAIFDEVIANKKIDGVNITTSYITGGLFSLDGVHPTPKGYMIIANQFIKAINTTYGSNIPVWDVNLVNPRGVKFLK